MLKEFTIKTRSRVEMVDITHLVNKAIEESGITEGICVVYVPHTTAAVTINENADPSVAEDIKNQLSKLVPPNAGYRHLEGNADAHIKSATVGPSCAIPISGRRLLLGTWQGIFFCEFDGPRTRRVIVKIVAG